MSLNAEPFLLRPAAKSYLWGGQRLKSEYNKSAEETPLAETWECSVHREGQSLVSGGEFSGYTLAQVLELHPEYLGKHTARPEDFPILVKLIDAKEKLSVQVHPDDRYASEHENGQRGKCEMWYVLDAEENAELLYGFKEDLSRKALEESIRSGSVEKYVRKVKAEKNDVFFIEAGTVHAIGRGIILAEIQENSNLTYRLFDYDRLDGKGNKRELHVNKALDVINTNSSSEPKQPMRVLRYHRGYAEELLCRCRYFEVHRVIVNTEAYGEAVEYHTDGLSFRTLLCIDGNGRISWDGGNGISFEKGDCIFYPASSTQTDITGSAQLLEIRC